MNKIIVLSLCVFLFSCGSNLKGKSPFWYNGYVYATQAYSLFAQGKLQSAIAFYKKGLAEAERYDIPAQVALYKFNIGRCLYELDRFDSACGYFSQSNREYLLLFDTGASFQSAGFAALSYCSKENVDSAFLWYKQCCSLGEKNDRALWLFVHGRLIWARDHGKEALNYYEEAALLYKKQKAYSACARMAFYRAEIYYVFKDYAEAKKLIDEALMIGDKSEERYGRWRILCAAAKIAYCQNDKPASVWYYDRALKCVPQGLIIPAFEKFMVRSGSVAQPD